MNEEFIITGFKFFLGLIAFVVSSMFFTHTGKDDSIIACIILFFISCVAFPAFAQLLVGVPYSIQEETQTIKLSNPISTGDSYYSLSYGNSLTYVDDLGYIKNIELNKSTKVQYKYAKEPKIVVKKELGKYVGISNVEKVKKIIIFEKVPLQSNVQSVQN